MKTKNDLTVMAGILIPYYKRAITIDADSEYISLTVTAEDGSQPASNYPDNIKHTKVTFMFDTWTGCFDGLLTSSGHSKEAS
jgi:hypothetical protein